MQHHLLPFVLLAGGLFAQSVVVPNANATTLGTSQLNSIIRNAGNPRTYQYGINASELAGVPVGSVITGVSLRFMVFASNSAVWPPADITWTNYDIYAGPAIPTATWVADPALNFASPPQQVRSGPMTLDAGVFTNLGVAGTVNPWAEFYFDFQVPYLYLGGDLALLFSHPGSTDPTTAQYPEVVTVNAAAHGVARVQSIYPAGTATAATTFYVMRIHYGYGTGCPSSLGTAPVLVQNANLTGGAGGNILLQVGNVPPISIVVYALGALPLSVPIGNGCTLLVTPDVLTFEISNLKGRALLTFPVPPAVVGSFFAQAAVLDPAVPGGLAVTNGVSPVAN
ncbi:MAG TPA: hypothetical protein VFZ65_21860 [Planctomycetota bacterium]|nr:hypothetical protein [Planctomycetota bacterium]